MENVNDKFPLCHNCKSLLSQNTCDDDNNKGCSLCFNILNISNQYDDIINSIQKELLQFEYTNIKLITNFTSIFDLLHWYIKIKFLRENKFTNTIDTINTGTIRKSFKPLFIEKASKHIDIKQNEGGDIEVVICFDFNDDIYNKVNSIISSCGSELRISSADDKSKVKQITNEILNEILLKEFDTKLDISSINAKISYRINPDSFYISGYYLKLSREIGQTKYERNGVKLCKSSVDEEIRERIAKYFGNSKNDLIFSGGGREDRDVRMLGNGREFIYEVKNAKKKSGIDYIALEKEFNEKSSLVKIYKVNKCDKKHFIHLKSSEDEKTKKYICVVWSRKTITDKDIEKINNIKNVQIVQKTPLRVLHKRVLKDREKKIIKLNVIQKINEHFFTLEVLSSAGTYIKEFIHGDLGRSKPSLCDIINSQCDILQLDVEDIIY